MPAIPNVPPLTATIPFEQRLENGYTVYQLQTDRLSDALCHLFFPPNFREEGAIVEVLERFVFPPNRPSNQRFNIGLIQLGNMPMIWCSFPQEYRETCAKIAEQFGLSVMPNSRRIVFSSNLQVHLPKDSKLLNFEGLRNSNNQELQKQRDDMLWVNNQLERSGID